MCVCVVVGGVFFLAICVVGCNYLLYASLQYIYTHRRGGKEEEECRNGISEQKVNISVDDLRAKFSVSSNRKMLDISLLVLGRRGKIVGVFFSEG